MKTLPIHRSHPDIIKCLKRAEGHLRTIIEMIKAERGCLDVAQQLHAVEKAVNAAKKSFVHDHIDKLPRESNGPRIQSATGSGG